MGLNRKKITIPAGYLDLTEYITDFTGVVDQSVGLAQAESDAYTYKKTLYHPGGTILSGPIELRVPVIGLPSHMISSTRGRSVFASTVVNGGKAYYSNNNSAGCYFENICFLGSGIAGSGTAQNAIGLSLGEFDNLPSESHSVRRGLLRNVLIKGFTTGCHLIGWLNNYHNLWVTDCDLGLKIQQANGCFIDLICENNIQDFIMDTSAGTTFPRLQLEGAYGVTPSTINSCYGIHIGALYLEQPTRTTPWLYIGNQLKCRDIHIQHGNVHGAGEGVTPIQFDDIVGFSCDPYFNTSAAGTSYSVTSKSLNDRSGMPNISGGFPAADSAHGLQKLALNVFPNPFMVGKRWGIYNLEIGGSPARASYTQETANVRTCNSAIKVLPVVGAVSSYISFRIMDANIVNALKGKAVTIGGWMYVPDLESMRPTTTGYKAAAITMATKLANVSVGSTYSSQPGYYQTGKWNFFSVVHPSIDPSVDEITINIFMNNSQNIAVDGEYVILDSLFMAEGSCAAQIFSGNVVDSPLNPVVMQNGLMTLKTPSTYFDISLRGALDVDQTWEVGDRIEFTNVAAGGEIGRVCTTGGIGGTAVWKTLGNLGA